MKLFTALALSALFSTQAAQAESQECLFGDTIGSIEESADRLVSKDDVLKTFKLSRIPGDQKRKLLVSVSVITDKKTGNVYHMNTTFMDKYDGGNVIGWIEDMTNAEDEGADHTGRVVATIGDGDIENCRVFK